jgi:YHS domain-containing protein
MTRSLLIAALAAAAVFAQSQSPRKSDEKSSQAQKQAQIKEETGPQTDLVCGMTVDPKTAEGKYAYKGKNYYFCSKEDQQEFAKAPDRYIKNKK